MRYPKTAIGGNLVANLRPRALKLTLLGGKLLHQGFGCWLCARKLRLELLLLLLAVSLRIGKLLPQH